MVKKIKSSEVVFRSLESTDSAAIADELAQLALGADERIRNTNHADEAALAELLGKLPQGEQSDI